MPNEISPVPLPGHPQPTSQLQPTPPATDSQAILSAIDFEIDSARAAAERPGWSPWAFAAAIGAVTWALVDEVLLGRYGTSASLVLTVYVLLSAEAVRAVWRFWGLVRPDETGRRFFRGASDLRRSRPDLLFSVVLWPAYFAIHITAEAVLSPALWWGVTAVLVLLSLASLLLLILLFSALPVPLDSSSVSSKVRRRTAVAAVLVAVVTGVVVGDALDAGELAGGFYVKGVMLVVALVSLIEGFLRQPEPLPQLADLQDLRRAVMYDALDLHEASRRLRVLARGSDVSDLVYSNAMACLRSVDIATSMVRTCIDRLSAIKGVATRSSGPLDAAERSVITTCLQDQQALMMRAAGARRAAVDEYSRMRKRWSLLGPLRQTERDLVASVDEFLIGRDKVIDALENERKALAQEVLKVLEDRDGHASSANPAAQ